MFQVNDRVCHIKNQDRKGIVIFVENNASILVRWDHGLSDDPMTDKIARLFSCRLIKL
jgi:hypothetical protein